MISRTRNLSTGQTRTLRVAGLFGILLFSFWSGMGPHWDYPYPLHVDEWFALGYAQITVESGGLEYRNPYGPWEISFHPEMGFHLLLGFVKTVTGLSWMSLYRIGPGVLLALLAFLTYAFGQRSGFGWAAALFVPLIPTSVRTLGPAFLVPVSAAMLFIPVTLLVLNTTKENTRGKSLWVLLLLVSGTLFVHPPTEMVVTALAVLFLAGLVVESLTRRQYGQGARLVLAIGVRMLIPLVILGFWLPALSQKVLEQSVFNESGMFAILGLHTGFPQAFGIVAVAASIIGLFLFIARGDGVWSYTLPFFTLLLLVFLAFFFPRYRLGTEILYDRGWLYLGLFMAIFAGFGVALYFRHIPLLARTLISRLGNWSGGWVAACLGLLGVGAVLYVLVTGLITNDEGRRYSGYYHIIDESIFADFFWMGQHTAPGRVVALGEPTMAWAYPPVAGPGTEVFQAISAPWSNPKAEKTRQMLALGEGDGPWLKESGVAIFYTCRPQTFACAELSNTDLFKVRRGVYLIPDSAEAR